MVRRRRACEPDNRHPCRLSLCGWTPPIHGSLRCYTVVYLTSGHGFFHCDGLQPGFEWLHAGYQRMGAVPGR